jgi:hypothetical protein
MLLRQLLSGQCLAGPECLAAAPGCFVNSTAASAIVRCVNIVGYSLCLAVPASKGAGQAG